ncbi:MAG: YciK family oxidoreductase [Pseudomonadota bacterium]
MKIKQYRAGANILSDKIIAVTGAGDGIGRAMAKAFASQGATVILMGKTVEKLEGVYDEIVNAQWPQAAIIPIDFERAVDEDYLSVAQAINESFDRVDGLLHNASILGDRTPIHNYQSSVWHRVLQVNLNAPFMLTKAVLPLLKQAPNASVIFTGSSVGLKGRAYWGAYGISKAATENLMQILADELEEVSRIRVNSINPGATRTQMRADAYPAEDPATVKTAESLVPLYTYLLADDSKDITGQQFNGNDYANK